MDTGGKIYTREKTEEEQKKEQISGIGCGVITLLAIPAIWWVYSGMGVNGGGTIDAIMRILTILLAVTMIFNLIRMSIHTIRKSFDKTYTLEISDFYLAFLGIQHPWSNIGRIVLSGGDLKVYGRENQKLLLFNIPQLHLFEAQEEIKAEINQRNVYRIEEEAQPVKPTA